MAASVARPLDHLGGIQAVEKLDTGGGVLEGAEAAGAEQGGVAGSAEGPQAQRHCSKVWVLRVIRSATVWRGRVRRPRASGRPGGSFQWGVEGGEVLLPDRGQEQAGRVEGGAMAT